MLVPAIVLAAAAGIAAAIQQSGSSIATARILEAIGTKPGITVCEMGAGDGELSLAAAKAVGAQGRVLTSELGDDRVKTLQRNVSEKAEAGSGTITVVAGDPNRTNFDEGACDALFMRNVYHHFKDPPTITASMLKSMKPGGKVAVVDFTPPDKEAPTPADRDKDNMHGVLPDSVKRELTAAGFEIVGSEDASQRWFMVVAARPRN